MSRETILAKVASLDLSPIVVQAQWDGDSTGWHVYFSASTTDGQLHQLGILSGGGDIRLFNGQVPPWPEAIAAQQLGRELAERYSAEFYFPSPDHPEDDCPDWKDRDKGYPCRRCGIPLLQSEACPWRGVCYHCHLDEEREEREAQWTPEQRMGPRCHICGNPATSELNGAPVCASCFAKYEVYSCEKCGCVTMLPKSASHTAWCKYCELQNAVDSLTLSQRDTIRNAMAQGQFEGISSALDVMNCSLSDAQSVLHMLASHTTEEPE